LRNALSEKKKKNIFYPYVCKEGHPVFLPPHPCGGGGGGGGFELCDRLKKRI